MKGKQEYSPEFREEAVKLVTEPGLTPDEAARRLTIPKGTGQLGGCSPREEPQHACGQSHGGGTGTGEQPVAQRTGGCPDGARHLNNSDGVLCQGVATRYAFMKQWRRQFPVDVLSRVLDVSRSGFYAWLTRKPSRRRQEDDRLKIAIQAAHRRTRQSYGSRRLQPELAADGCHAGRNRMGRRRRELTSGYLRSNR